MVFFFIQVLILTYSDNIFLLAVRERSKQLASLLSNDARLSDIRHNGGGSSDAISGGGGMEDELQKALKASERQFILDEMKRNGNAGHDNQEYF